MDRARHWPQRALAKSSTLAAILDKMNEDKLITSSPLKILIEVSASAQEIDHSSAASCTRTRPVLRWPCAPLCARPQKSFSLAKCVNRETIEIALEASETGHLVLSTLHTIDASKTVERIVGVFPLSDQQSIRTRLSKAFGCIVSQRLLPRKDGKGRIAAVEILKSTMRTRDYVEREKRKASLFSMPCAMAAPRVCSTSMARLKNLFAPASLISKPESRIRQMPENFRHGNGRFS